MSARNVQAQRRKINKVILIVFAAALVVLVGAAVIGTVLTGKTEDPSVLDAPGKRACDLLNAGSGAATNQAARADLAARALAEGGQTKTPKLAADLQALPGATGTTEAWQRAFDTAALTCVGAGWKP